MKFQVSSNDYLNSELGDLSVLKRGYRYITVIYKSQIKPLQVLVIQKSALAKQIRRNHFSACWRKFADYSIVSPRFARVDQGVSFSSFHETDRAPVASQGVTTTSVPMFEESEREKRERALLIEKISARFRSQRSRAAFCAFAPHRSFYLSLCTQTGTRKRPGRGEPSLVLSGQS